MPSVESTTSAADPIPGFPSSNFRTGVTFLLLLHFFALFVAVCSNGPHSNLENRLRRVPGVRAYLQLLVMDLSYRFNFTAGQETDVDHFFEVDLKVPDQATPVEIRLPTADMQPVTRRVRFERLARTAASLADNPNLGPWLVQAVAGQLVAEHGATGGVIRVRRHMVQALEDIGVSDAQAADPNSDAYFRTVYEANILVGRDGRVDVAKIDAAGEAAPAAAP